MKSLAQTHRLTSLKMILSTGSPLMPQSYEYVYRSIKKDLLLGSISGKHCLTLSQTTKYRLFLTERLCRWQFQIWWKWQKALQTGRLHCGKRRNCSNEQFLLFLQCFQIPLLETHKTKACLGKDLSFTTQLWLLTPTRKRTFYSMKLILGKIENAGNQPRINCTILATIKLSFANACNFDQAKILS